MITLFRRIRQKLIDSGSATKYLLYAAGEILLVVIGILIALQVNNWNEHRKDKNLERTYYENLVRDLNNQLDEIEIQYQSELFVKESLARMIAEVNNDFDNTDPLQFGRDMTLSTINRTVNLYDATFQDLKSTGNLNLIGNAELKTDILDFYQLANRMIHVLTKNGEGFHHTIMGPILDNLLINVDLTALNVIVDYTGFTQLEQEILFETDSNNKLHQLLISENKDPDDVQHIKNFITYRKWTNDVSIAFLAQMKGNAEQLITNVRTEIDS